MPEWRVEIASRLRALRLDPAREIEIIDELSQHLDERHEELLAAGANAEEALRTALSELLDSEALAAEMRPLRQAQITTPEPHNPRLAGLSADLRIAIRSLVKQRAFTLAAVLTFAIGISSATAIATIVDGVLLRPLPYPDAERIVQVISYRREGAATLRVASMARPFLLELSERSRSFADIGVFDSFSNVTRRRLTMTIAGRLGAAELSGTRISPVLFSMLGARPQLGRLLVPGDERPEHNQLIVLSD